VLKYNKSIINTNLKKLQLQPSRKFIPFLNLFEYFYKKQIRKDLIDKLNLNSILDLDLDYTIKYRAKFKSVFDMNLKNIRFIVLLYQYLIESFLNQKVCYNVTYIQNINRDIEPFYLHSYICNLASSQFFSLVQLIYILLFYQQKYKFHSKPHLIFILNDNTFIIKNINLNSSSWTTSFSNCDTLFPLYSVFSIFSKSPFILLSVLLRCQILRYFKISYQFMTTEKDRKMKTDKKIRFNKLFVSLKKKKSN
jgi:hypothetical protein